MGALWPESTSFDAILQAVLLGLGEAILDEPFATVYSGIGEAFPLKRCTGMIRCDVQRRLEDFEGSTSVLP